MTAEMRKATRMHELKQAIEWGEIALKGYKEDGEQVPEYVYERLLHLYREALKVAEEA